MNSPVDFVVRGPSNSLNDVHCQATYAGDLFVVVKVCVESATLFFRIGL